MEASNSASMSSVEISRTAKGETTWSVKVYRAAGEEDEAKAVAMKINGDLLRLYYP